MILWKTNTNKSQKFLKERNQNRFKRMKVIGFGEGNYFQNYFILNQLVININTITFSYQLNFRLKFMFSSFNTGN